MCNTVFRDRNCPNLVGIVCDDIWNSYIAIETAAALQIGIVLIFLRYGYPARNLFSHRSYVDRIESLHDWTCSSLVAAWHIVYSLIIALNDAINSRIEPIIQFSSNRMWVMFLRMLIIELRKRLFPHILRQMLYIFYWGAWSIHDLILDPSLLLCNVPIAYFRQNSLEMPQIMTNSVLDAFYV